MPARKFPRNPDKDYINTQDVARMFDVCDVVVRNWVHRGVLPQPIVMSRKVWVWKRQTILDYLKAKEIAAQAKHKSRQRA